MTINNLSATLVSLVECPRDAMQGWRHLIPAAEKTAYLNQLLQVGFDTLDFGSFVSPKAIPQMADTAEVLAGLDWQQSATKLLAIVANERGAVEACSHEAIRYLGFPFSISETFQQRNANSSIAESLERVADIQELCIKTGKELVVYLSMGFGNPYGDPYSPEVALAWVNELVELDIRIISLADTVGVATPEQVFALSDFLVRQLPDRSIGVHLHAGPGQWEEKLDAAFRAGIRRFDGALNGIGGCPMAGDELVGNMDTLHMIPWFRERGVLPILNEAALLQSRVTANRIFN